MLTRRRRLQRLLEFAGREVPVEDGKMQPAWMRGLTVIARSVSRAAAFVFAGMCVRMLPIHASA